MTQLKPFDDLYAVPILKGAKNVTLIQSHSYFYSPRLEHSIGGVDLLEGNWEFLFTTESATEQDWAGVVESWPSVSGEAIRVYQRYPDEIPKCRTATASGHSLLAANGLEGNYAIVKQVN